MSSEGIRQSDRVTLQMQVEASWSVNGSGETRQPAKTLMVSRNGGVILLPEKFFPGQEITLHRKLDGDQTKSARARIVAEIDREARKGPPTPSDHAPVVIDLDEPGTPFDAGWEGALARIAARTKPRP